MRQRSKKIFSMLLSIAMVLLMLPTEWMMTEAFALDEETESGISIIKKEYTISAYNAFIKNNTTGETTSGRSASLTVSEGDHVIIMYIGQTAFTHWKYVVSGLDDVVIAIPSKSFTIIANADMTFKASASDLPAPGWNDDKTDIIRGADLSTESGFLNITLNKDTDIIASLIVSPSVSIRDSSSSSLFSVRSISVVPYKESTTLINTSTGKTATSSVHGWKEERTRYSFYVSDYLTQNSFTNYEEPDESFLFDFGGSLLGAWGYQYYYNASFTPSYTHEWDNGKITKEATHMETGIREYTCKYCGDTKTEDIDKIAEHTYGSEWSYDENGHWHECECGEKDEVIGHTFGEWKVQKLFNTMTSVCTVCGYEETRDLLSAVLTMENVSKDENGNYIAYLGESGKLCVSAAGGTEEFTYTYWILDEDTGVWEPLQSDDTSAEYTLREFAGAGTYQLKATIKDTDGFEADSNVITLIVNDTYKELSGVLSINGNDAINQTAEVGSTLNLAVTATGGRGSYTYKFAVLDSSTNKWTVLRDFSTDSTYAYKAASAGKKEFAVSVKDSKGNTVAAKRVVVNITAAEPLSGKLTVDGSTNALVKAVGSKITLKAEGAGGSGSYTYKWAVLNLDTNKWSILKDFSTVSTYTYDLNYTGKKSFAVTVKDSTGKTVATNRIVVDVVKQTAALSGKLTVDGSTDALVKAVGSTITLKAEGAGGSGSYTYKWAVLNVDTNKWSILKDFSTQSTYTYALNYTGKKEFAVTVKDSTGKTVSTNRISVNVQKAVSTELAATATINGKSDNLSLSVGDTVKIDVTATGGTGKYTYKYVVLNVNTGAWVTLKDYSEASSYTTKIASTGSKQFVVSVKDSSGKVVSTKRISVTAS